MENNIFSPFDCIKSLFNKMLSGLDAYRSSNKKYTYDFDGDDQLSELNDGISEIIVENQQLRKRLADLRSRMNNEEK